MSILVFGSTGTVGSLLVQSLLQRIPADSNTRVRLLVRDQAKAQQKFGSSNLIEYVVSEKGLEDESLDHKLFSGVERVFLLWATTPTLAKVEKALVERAIKHAGTSLKHIVKLSVLNASVDRELGDLQRWHGLAEQAVFDTLQAKAPQVALTILRPNNFYSNIARDDAGGIKAQGVFYRPGVEQQDFRVSFVDPRDIADVAATVLTEPAADHTERTYNITGPEALTYQEVAERATRGIGKQVKVQFVDDVSFFNTLKSYGLPAAFAFCFVKLYQSYRTSNVTNKVFQDVELVTGKKPRSIEAYFAENKQLFL